MSRKVRKIPVALVQFDARPEEVAHNLDAVERLATKAAADGARWIMFHEASLCDYTPRLAELAEAVPGGPSTRRVRALAERLGCFLSVGLAEKNRDRYHITQVFAGPDRFFYRYRKTWLWRQPDDEGYRDEWKRYDPGAGPEPFMIDGVRATCFICADGRSGRCIERARLTRPQVVFYPNNRGAPISAKEVSGYARIIGAPVLLTNRVGRSWRHDCRGGCAVVSPTGRVLARANTRGREQILHWQLELSAAPAHH